MRVTDSNSSRIVSKSKNTSNSRLFFLFVSV
jgi:hypothetical protein